MGAMEIAKDLTVEYMHTRKQFGVIIGKFQALQHRMADVLIEIEQMRSAVVNAAGHLGDDRKNREWYAASAKHMAGRIGRQVAEEAIQIHGGMGMTWEYPVGHYSKRLIMLDHLFGDADHHLQRFIELGE
jgi:alkylation response protein AidB-like acyl-CoA dehydrogenase